MYLRSQKILLSIFPLLVLPLLFLISGCTGTPSKTLPEKEMITKIKSAHELGIIAESADTTYFFTDEKAKLISLSMQNLCRIYAEF